MIKGIKSKSLANADILQAAYNFFCHTKVKSVYPSWRHTAALLPEKKGGCQKQSLEVQRNSNTSISRSFRRHWSKRNYMFNADTQKNGRQRSGYLFSLSNNFRHRFRPSGRCKHVFSSSNFVPALPRTSSSSKPAPLLSLQATYLSHRRELAYRTDGVLPKPRVDTLRGRDGAVPRRGGRSEQDVSQTRSGRPSWAKGNTGLGAAHRVPRMANNKTLSQRVHAIFSHPVADKHDGQNRVQDATRRKRVIGTSIPA